MAYPFEFLRQKLWPCDTGNVYMLFPFSESAQEFVANTLDVAIRELGLNPLSAKSVSGARPLLHEILKGIAEAEIVVGILFERNPNVFWEVGVAMTWKPATQVLTIGRKGQDDEAMPFNLKGYKHIFVVENDKQGTQEILKGELRALRESHSALVEETVVAARNSLGPSELDIIGRYGMTSHFVLPRGLNLEDVIYMAGSVSYRADQQGVRNLCALGLLALNTRGKEYSFYWTPLGNRVLYLLKEITSMTPEEVNRRRVELADTVPEILNWRGGYVFPPPLHS